jgi:hypothetical protein
MNAREWILYFGTVGIREKSLILTEILHHLLRPRLLD